MLSRERENHCRNYREALNSLSDCVLVVPDITALSFLVGIDQMIKKEREGKSTTDFSFDLSFRQLGKIVNRLEKQGVFIPNNFNLGGKWYLPVLKDLGIPVVYSQFLFSDRSSLSRSQIEQLVDHCLPGFPPLFVVKPVLGHRGEGIRAVEPEQLGRIEAGENGVVVQPFCWPRKDKGLMVDVRVITLEGEPRVWCARQAGEPLINPVSGQLIEFPPSPSRFLANIAQGGEVVNLPRSLQRKLFDLARRTCSAVETVAYLVRRRRMKVRNPGKINLGLISVDILLGEEGLVVGEVDSNPQLYFFPDLTTLAKFYLDYLEAKAKGKSNPIVLLEEILTSFSLFPPGSLEKGLEQRSASFMNLSVKIGGS